MKRILIILINIIFINMIASTSNRENIASIISIFISLQLLFLLKLYITIEYPKLTIVRENLYFSLLLLLIIFLIENERIKFFILELMIITISGSIVLSIYLFIKKLEMFYIFYLLNILFLINFWINRILDLDKSFPYKLVISETSLLLNSLYILYILFEYKYILKIFESKLKNKKYYYTKNEKTYIIIITLIVYLLFYVDNLIINYTLIGKIIYIKKLASHLSFLILMSLSIIFLSNIRKITRYLKVILYFLITIIFYKYGIYEEIFIVFIGEVFFEMILNYQEALVVNMGYIILAKPKGKEVKIKYSEKIKIFYIKRNIISCLLNFIIKRKQIYITDGDKEIYFGYFISPKKYKEILAFISKVHQE